MGLLDLLRRKERWRHSGTGPPPAAVVQALNAVIAAGNSERAQALHHAVELTTAGCEQRGSNAEAVAAALCEGGILGAAAEALGPSAHPLDHTEVQALLQLATNLSGLSGPVFSRGLEESGLVPALIQLLGGDKCQPTANVSAATAAAGAPGPSKAASSKGAQPPAVRPLELLPADKVAVLRCLRLLARHTAVRDELKQHEGVATLVSVLGASVSGSDLAMGGEAAWALEILAVSRKLCNQIGELGGVHAIVSLLRAALAPRPAALRELPRSEDAAAAASSTLHALGVLLTDCRANRVRLRAAGGGPVLAEALGDGQLEWEAREQAGSLLEELAATLLLDERPLAESAHFSEWRSSTLPRLVRTLQQFRGLAHMQQTKEAVAAVLEKLAGNGEECAVLVREAGALPPLVQLLSIGSQMAGGDRRLCCVALGALRQLAPASRDALGQATAPSTGRPVPLWDLLRTLIEEGVEGGVAGLAEGWEENSGAKAAWLAGAVVARLITGHHENQDRAVGCGMLRPLCTLLEAPVGSQLGEEAREAVLGIKCEIAEALRSVSLRSGHHAALRAAGAAQQAQRTLASDAPTWTELRAAARRLLQNLGDLPNLDRPLLTYTADQLAHLLQGQGIEPQRFRERGIGGAEFVRLSDAAMRDVVLASQHPRALRVLRAYETFNEIDCAGTRDGYLTFTKLATYLGGRGLRTDEVAPLAESLMQLMDGDRDDLVAFPDFLQCYDEFRSRSMLDVQPPSKKRRTAAPA